MPTFYEPQRIGTLYAPRVLEATLEGRSAQLPPAHQDKRRVALLLIDAQVDFIHEDGALSVPGAIDDTRRTIEWIFDHVDQLTTIAASLDSHLPLQIFSPAWWISRSGEHPAPFTVISHDAVADGTWTPLYEAEWSREYTRLLEAQARKQLMIWPYHTLIGTPGHAMTPALYEAVAYHASARSTQPLILQKGSEPRTEHYSIFEPEVKLPDQPDAFNRNLLQVLASHDLVYIAGQAKSHCVLETLNSLIRTQDEALIRKLRVLADAMSSVAHPQIDFDRLADEQLQQHTQVGLRLVDTREPIA
jgi:nicotinamidase/pyrazinamidase